MSEGGITGSRRCAGALVALLLSAAPAWHPAVASTLAAAEGHVALGYAQLVTSGAPGGNLSVTGGVDLPVVPSLRAGIDLGYHLLGSRAVARGSLSANVSYSAFEAAAFAHWSPKHLGPVTRLSIGPALLAAHADLSAAAGGAGFSDLALDETAGAVAFEATAVKRAPSPVRIGFQVGALTAFLPGNTWTIISARVSFHY
jgi:hypothetical protein